MTDRELLERAAKAICDSATEYNERKGVWLERAKCWWNPRDDDGDALRLAVRLHIDLNISNGISEAIWIDEARSEYHSIEVPCDEAFEGYDAKYAATRRAIVRAAAEMAK